MGWGCNGHVSGCHWAAVYPSLVAGTRLGAGCTEKGDRVPLLRLTLTSLTVVQSRGLFRNGSVSARACASTAPCPGVQRTRLVAVGLLIWGSHLPEIREQGDTSVFNISSLPGERVTASISSCLELGSTDIQSNILVPHLKAKATRASLPPGRPGTSWMAGEHGPLCQKLTGRNMGVGCSIPKQTPHPS